MILMFLFFIFLQKKIYEKKRKKEKEKRKKKDIKKYNANVTQQLWFTRSDKIVELCFPRSLKLDCVGFANKLVFLKKLALSWVELENI
jgi:hypothetical protein